MGVLSKALQPLNLLRRKVSGIKARSPFWRIVLNKYTIVTLFFLAVVAFIDTNNLIQLFRTQKTLNAQERMIDEYERKINEYGRRIKALKSNKDSLECFAREEYMYLEDGEDIYVIE